MKAVRHGLCLWVLCPAFALAGPAPEPRLPAHHDASAQEREAREARMSDMQHQMEAAGAAIDAAEAWLETAADLEPAERRKRWCEHRLRHRLGEWKSRDGRLVIGRGEDERRSVRLDGDMQKVHDLFDSQLALLERSMRVLDKVLAPDGCGGVPETHR